MARQSNKVKLFHLLLMPIPFGIAGVTWFLFYLILSKFHALLMPSEIILEGWREIGKTLSLVPFFFVCLPVGFYMTNELLRVIPFFRGIAEKKGNYASSQKFLIRMIILLSLGILPFVIWGFFDYYYVTEEKIVSNSLFSITGKKFGWDEVDGIKTKLYFAEYVRLKYILKMHDGNQVDIAECNGNREIIDFLNKYNKIKPFLGKRPLLLDSEIQLKEKDLMKRGYGQKVAEEILHIASLRDFGDK